MFGINPWILLGAVLAFLAWSGTITVVAYNKGYDAKEAEYNAAALEKLNMEAEAAKDVSEARQDERKEIDRTKREIKDEAKQFNDAPASNRLRAISDGLRKRWDKDHQ